MSLLTIIFYKRLSFPFFMHMAKKNPYSFIGGYMEIKCIFNENGSSLKEVIENFLAIYKIEEEK